MSGLLLKNNLKLRLASIPQDVIEYIKSTIFDAIADPVAMIRNTVSTVIDQLLVTLQPENWPEALSKLVELVDSQDKNAQEVGPERGLSCLAPGSV